jgi:hypothetical protein
MCTSAGSEKLHFSFSGLDSAETCWVKRLVRAIGEWPVCLGRDVLALLRTMNLARPAHFLALLLFILKASFTSSHPTASGFSWYLSKLIDFYVPAGGNLPPTFSRRSTHLLCPSARGAKYDKARLWGVSVVGMEWLIALATTGKVPDPRDFEVAPGAENATTMDVDDYSPVRDLKGKGKANQAEDEDVTIVDITNGKLGCKRVVLC